MKTFTFEGVAELIIEKINACKDLILADGDSQAIVDCLEFTTDDVVEVIITETTIHIRCKVSMESIFAFTEIAAKDGFSVKSFTEEEGKHLVFLTKDKGPIMNTVTNAPVAATSTISAAEMQAATEVMAVPKAEKSMEELIFDVSEAAARVMQSEAAAAAAIDVAKQAMGVCTAAATEAVAAANHVKTELAQFTSTQTTMSSSLNEVTSDIQKLKAQINLTQLTAPEKKADDGEAFLDTTMGKVTLWGGGALVVAGLGYAAWSYLGGGSSEPTVV